MKQLAELLAQILQLITERYVMDELPIPEDVLALKDEACGIIIKAADEPRAEILNKYARRLVEIRAQLSDQTGELWK